MHVVWFKRDLRVGDHAPLVAAAASGAPVAPLYILEPELWAEPHLSGRHHAFLTDCVRDLDGALATMGARLIVRLGEAVDVFSDLHARYGLTAIHAHEETGLLWTYERDKAVRRWARRAGVPVLETPQHGVVRRLPTRNGWAKRWDRLMAQPIAAPPRRLRMAEIQSDAWPDAEGLGLARDPCPERQDGGRAAGLRVLDSFFHHRGANYRRAMSSPVTAFDACSRLSPHLAFGAVSMREAAQAAWAARNDKRRQGDHGFAASLDSFIGRLHWHCHFMQKLEDEPDLERRCLHPAYEGLRPPHQDPDRVLASWAAGATGFPFVDACMRALNATGWLNFRMRAMVTAFASYHLWRDWRAPAAHLARAFTDFEAGIHYPQIQMQSGVTGVNTARIYNPVKQSQDQDPNGQFIRHWVPELRDAPLAFLHEPWRMPEALQVQAGCVIGRDYPRRIVNHETAARAARERIYAVRRGEAYRAAANAIQDKHGSRKSGMRMRGTAARNRRSADNQTSFDFSDPS